MNTKPALFFFILILTACQSAFTASTSTAASTAIMDTGTLSRTPLPATSTATQTLTQTFTPSPPSPTVDLTLTRTLTPTPKPIRPTEGPGPGLTVHGYVKLADGTAVEGVNIYLAFSAYDGMIKATTNSNGRYSTDYIYIPGDETVRVWADLAGYSFKLAAGSAVWTGIEFYWRHYFGFEDTNLDFTAISEPIVK